MFSQFHKISQFSPFSPFSQFSEHKNVSQKIVRSLRVHLNFTLIRLRRMIIKFFSKQKKIYIITQRMFKCFNGKLEELSNVL